MKSRDRSVSAVVLAAGQGTRMRSARPKPLHVLGGRPMVRHVLDALHGVAASRIVVVVGHGADAMITKLSGRLDGVTIEFAEQAEQRGTGDAVGIALATLGAQDGAGDDVIVLPGDTPLLRPESLVAMVETHRSTAAAATALTARVDDATGYGRIIRDASGSVTGIVEHADATTEQRDIDEINTSIYCFRRDLLADALGRIRPDNAQGEWYLTDVIGVLHGDGHRVSAWVVDDPAEAQGVNDRVQLAAAEATLRTRINDGWMRAGVTLVDPASTVIDPDVELARDVTVFPGAVLRGATVVDEGAQIGPHAVLVDAVVGAGAVIGASAVLESGAVVEAGAQVDPLTLLVGSARRAQR
ncbi:MAG TPA: sugar phosphate nucleotidyltransferase [Acidimicrobiales bacterium]|nr:sugar phosphate nucleotidyltransferase [Acidimicrobiales bacterium]